MKKTITVLLQNALKNSPVKLSGKAGRSEDKPEDTRVAENELLKAYSNRDIYYRQMNYELDEHLIDYYNFLLRAEDKKIGYLRKLYQKSVSQDRAV